MNNYEKIVEYLIKNIDSQKWESKKSYPEILKKIGFPDKVFKTVLNDMDLYLYTILINKYNEDFNYSYVQEYIYCSIFIDGNEVDTFGFDNVSSDELYKLLDMIQEKVFDYKNRLKQILTC